MDATEMFLARHRSMHAHVDRLTLGLTDAQIRKPAHPGTNPLVWLIWHMARGEDGAVNLLVSDGPEVLDEGWSARLRVERRDVGTGMTMAEVVDLSDRVDLPALMAYWDAVGRRTRGVVASLRPSDLDEVVGPERVHRVVERLVAGPSGRALEELWQERTRGYFLAWLPLTHNFEHVGQADLIRGMLGLPGKF